jgi:hypothetical protein
MRGIRELLELSATLQDTNPKPLKRGGTEEAEEGNQFGPFSNFGNLSLFSPGFRTSVVRFAIGGYLPVAG